MATPKTLIVGILTLASATAAGSLVLGCSVGTDPNRLSTDYEGPGVSTDPGPGSPLPAEPPMTDAEKGKVQLVREAINLGLGLGKEALGETVNLELGQMGTTKRYVGTAKTGKAYFTAKADVTCPFLSAAPSGESIDCRAVVSRATVSAYARASALRAQNPLDSRFDTIKAEGEFHYGEGFSSGIDNEATAALYGLREQKLCDQAPKPAQSAFEAGVERGRGLYITELNKRFAEVGRSMRYPDDVTQITVCAANTSLLEPARSRAHGGAAAWAKQNPLCSDYKPSTQADLAAVADAEKQFAAGASQGIDTEHSLALEKIFRVVQCNTGDPLVLDLAGDGIALRAIAESGARFDLYGSGDKLPVAWVKGDDALLALDRNGNGVIDDGRELFGDVSESRGDAGNGFANLATYDSPAKGGDGDGKITARDAIYSQLVVWQDADGDGASAPSELRTLAEVGVVSLDLRDVRAGGGASVSHRSTFERAAWATLSTGSTTGQLVDVWLEHGRTRVW